MRGVLIVACYVLGGACVCVAQTMTCVQGAVGTVDASCKCRISGGGDDGKWIDLSPLSGQVIKPTGSSAYNYTWRVCQYNKGGEHEPGSTCTEVYKAAACQLTGSTFTCTGRQNASKFSHHDGHWHLTYLEGEYAGGDFKKNRTTDVELICDASASKYTATVTNDESTVDYKFHLTSKYACPTSYSPSKSHGHKLSIGSVMVIIFFVLLVAYLVGGAVYLRGARGAEGVEMCPNYSFWSSLPGLIKDGVMFAMTPCRGEKSGYETI